jgi:hypothetical protein
LILFTVGLVANRLLGPFLVLSIPPSLLLAFGSPFYHFRYLELLYPVLLLLANIRIAAQTDGIRSSRSRGEPDR